MQYLYESIKWLLSFFNTFTVSIKKKIAVFQNVFNVRVIKCLQL